MEQRVSIGENPVHQSQIRCVFAGGPLDGKTTDVDAYLPWQTPPETITASHPLKPGTQHEYRRDGDVEDRPHVGRVLRMRYAGSRPAPSPEPSRTVAWDLRWSGPPAAGD
jgi:hypothetical protein